MAAEKDQIVCHVCGFKNDAKAERCVSCGAKLEELAGAYTAEEELRKKAQPDRFSLVWAAIALVVHLVLQAIALVLLPLVVDAYEPQGFSALMISLVVWLVGGVLIGWASPGKTFLEPAAGAFIAVVPTVWYIVYTTPSAPEHLGGGFSLTMPAYVIGGLLGGMVSLFGAYLGEKLQDMTRGRRPVDRKRR